MTRLRASVREPTAVGGSTPWWRQDWLFALLLLIFTALAYLPALNGTPIWDDDAHITRPELRSWDGLIVDSTGESLHRIEVAGPRRGSKPARDSLDG